MVSDKSDIRLYLSNRLENLADALIQELAGSGNPVTGDTILVQSRGMARWLNLRIADKTGIQMNTRYIYPRALIGQLLLGFLPEDTEAKLDNFSPTVLFWRIYRLLPEMVEAPKAAVLRQYLASEQPASAFMRRYQLAMKIAQLFDQMQIYRPDFLTIREESNSLGDWKAVVWKSLQSDSNDHPSFPTLLENFHQRIGGLNSRPAAWPTRLHLIGISSIPPSYMEILSLASQWMPIRIFLTQPSPLYWGDQLTRKRKLKEESKAMIVDSHPLLGNLGKQGQDFLNSLIDAEIFATESSEFFSPPRTDHLLGILQKDLYELNSPAPGKKQVSESGSLQIHICHNPKREIETLKNELHRRFETDPELTPDQVIVMAPDIEKYSSAIHTIFGASDDRQGCHLPYSIADHSTLTSSPAASGLLAFLKLLQGRITTNEVISFLNIPVISHRFEFGEDDWIILRNLIEDTAIRWGTNARHREQTTGMAFREFSWEQGVDRLLAGYCVHPDERSDWDELNPYQNLEGNAVSLLSRFLEFWQFLEQQQSLATAVLKTSEWLEITENIIRFFYHDPGKPLEEAEALISLVNDIQRELDNSRSDDSMVLKVLSSILEDRLSKDFQAGGFFSGTITFCSLKPMRNIPAAFIALIGMEESAFPRQDFRTEFSTLPGKRRIGDRSTREDDRYLFLESLLAARKYLYISYPGIDGQTLADQPGSIVVDELLDILDEYYHFPEGKSSREVLVEREPLQAFSPKNFLHPQPKSFAQDQLHSALALVGPRHTPEPFIEEFSCNEPLPVSAELPSLLRFFRLPCVYWLKHSLGIEFPYSARLLKDTEPIESDPLLSYQLGTQQLESLLAPSSRGNSRLRDFLPVGALQAVAIQSTFPAVEAMANRYDSLNTGERHSLNFGLDLDGFQLTGQLNHISESIYLKARFGKIRPTDILATWIEHLCACSCIENPGFSTVCLGKEGEISFRHSTEARKILKSLTDLFQEGHAAPLPLFADTSHVYAKVSVNSGKHKRSPLELATKEFYKNPDGRFGSPGEAYDANILLCFPDREKALDERFEKCAMDVFGEALKHLNGVTIESRSI